MSEIVENFLSKSLFYFVLRYSDRDFKDSWLKTQNIHIVTQGEKMFQDNNIIWQGSLECLQNEEVENCLEFLQINVSFIMQD